jgi:hypothetical protein
MTTAESVIKALEQLLKIHRVDIMRAEQVNIGFLPNTGHGDDIWLRTEHIHVVAEVTLAGSGSLKSAPNGVKKQEVIEKIRMLHDRRDVTHAYLFVAETIVDWTRNRHDIGEVRARAR